tara:strand:+ start:3053 stop:4072 length:1020 start_codon:yes stop_codon:yes gene_type:complete
LKILVTGAAGFIGFHLSRNLIDSGYEVFGIDNINDYYDTKLKIDRLEILKRLKNSQKNWKFQKVNIEEETVLKEIFDLCKPEVVVNLAAQAGVRFSLEEPSKYIKSNIVGFGNLLECCKNHNVKHLIYASSSSVYGGNKILPFYEKVGANHPVSLYAATKRSNELMAHSYSHLFKLPTTGLRFFTVYGPWGRPDMAYYIFTSAIYKGIPIKIFNNGIMKRDFTYIDDVIEGIMQLIKKAPTKDNNFNYKNPNPASSWAPFKIFNIGNSSNIKLMSFIEEIEKALGMKAEKIFMPLQPGDVEETESNIDYLNNWTGFSPKTSLNQGIKTFVEWFKKYHQS